MARSRGRLAEPRFLWLTLGLTLAAGIAMLPALVTMSDHGASVTDWEFAGDVTGMREILDSWGETGESAAWWQLAVDIPFLVGYALFIAASCAAVARRAEAAGRQGLAAAAARAVWLGPLAAVGDMVQNASLAVVLSGTVSQPWVALSFAGGVVAFGAAAVGLAFAAGGWLATRRAQPA